MDDRHGIVIIPINKKKTMKKKLQVLTFERESKSKPGSFYKVTRHSDGKWSCLRADNGYPCKGWMWRKTCDHITQCAKKVKKS